MAVAVWGGHARFRIGFSRMGEEECADSGSLRPDRALVSSFPHWQLLAIAVV